MSGKEKSSKPALELVVCSPCQELAGGLSPPQHFIEGSVHPIKWFFPRDLQTTPLIIPSSSPPLISTTSRLCFFNPSYCRGGRSQSCQDRVIPSLLTAKSKSANLRNAGLDSDRRSGNLASPRYPPPRPGSSIRLNALLIFPQELPRAKRQLCSSVA